MIVGVLFSTFLSCTIPTVVVGSFVFLVFASLVVLAFLLGFVLFVDSFLAVDAFLVVSTVPELSCSFLSFGSPITMVRLMDKYITPVLT